MEASKESGLAERLTTAYKNIGEEVNIPLAIKGESIWT
jgi:hypothetical protein